ncbi:hypothetical protein NPIL_656491, partial [Nephila pilipes]
MIRFKEYSLPLGPLESANRKLLLFTGFRFDFTEQYDDSSK